MQLKDTINIFEFKHLDCISVWIFDCSSSHEGLTLDALNINGMNVNPGGKQRKMPMTIIPLNNPPPLPNELDTHGQVQLMVYPENDPGILMELWGKPNGMQVVLQEFMTDCYCTLWIPTVADNQSHQICFEHNSGLGLYCRVIYLLKEVDWYHFILWYVSLQVEIASNA